MHVPSNTRASRTDGRSGFTLVELLVVIGIIAILMAMLVTSASAARRESKTVQCQNNIRQLANALHMYAGEFKGKYPPNRSSPSPGQWWYDEGRIASYLPAPPGGVVPNVTVYVCPDDEGSRRSYSMNLWASSKVDAIYTPPSPLLKDGDLWCANARRASELVLLIEAWSCFGTAAAGFEAPATVGGGGPAGQRFGGGGGLPPFPGGPLGMITTHVTYARHRRAGGPGEGTKPVGRTVIAFADGHVQPVPNDAIVNYETGELTGLCHWSPLDFK